jgi:oxalate decarboxylase
MHSAHTFDIKSTKSQAICNGGSRTIANSDNFPILRGMATYSLRLDRGGVREPHWHPNAAELSYCLSGKALMTIFGHGAIHNTFTIERDEIAFVPQGFLHHIENISEEETKFIITFNHEKPEDIGISGSIGSIPNAALDYTFIVKREFFAKINKPTQDILIGKRSSIAKPEFPNIPNPYKFNLKEEPQIQSKIQNNGGTVILANAYSFPILNGLACYSLYLKKGGIREPHWHPNAAELDYVINGRARMVIFSPGGNIDTFEVGPDQIVFIPTAYFHYIENIGDEELHFAVFFSHEKPQDIGISGAFGAYSNEVFGAVFNVDPKVFESLPKYQKDLFVVAGGG